MFFPLGVFHLLALFSTCSSCILELGLPKLFVVFNRCRAEWMITLSRCLGCCSYACWQLLLPGYGAGLCSDHCLPGPLGLLSKRLPRLYKEFVLLLQETDYKHSIVHGLAQVTRVQEMRLPSGTLMQKISFLQHSITCHCLKNKHSLIKNNSLLIALKEMFCVQGQFQSREVFFIYSFSPLRMTFFFFF